MERRTFLKSTAAVVGLPAVLTVWSDPVDVDALLTWTPLRLDFRDGRYVSQALWAARYQPWDGPAKIQWYYTQYALTRDECAMPDYVRSSIREAKIFAAELMADDVRQGQFRVVSWNVDPDGAEDQTSAWVPVRSVTWHRMDDPILKERR